MKTPSNFAENLRTLRIRRGFSQKELALLTGVHKNVIYSYERGLTKPRATSLEKLAEALCCSSRLLAGPPLDADFEDPVFTVRENGRTVYYGSNIFACSSQFFAIMASVLQLPTGSVSVDISSPAEHHRVYDIHYGDPHETQAEDEQAV